MTYIKAFFANKRVKSFLWRTGMMILAVIVSQITDSLSLLTLSPMYITLLGLVLGEVSKWINTSLQNRV